MQTRSDDVVAPDLDPTRRARFDELAALAPGWWDGDQPAVAPAAIELAKQALAVLGPKLGNPGTSRSSRSPGDRTPDVTDPARRCSSDTREQHPPAQESSHV